MSRLRKIEKCLFERSLIPTFCVGFFLLFLRAWPRLLGPEIWNEDGNQNLSGFLERGLREIFQPANGYLIVVPKIITVLSASISIVYYPLVSTLVAWVITSLIFVIIARSPLQLKGGAWLGVFCFLVPTNPEVFGLPLYTFWWATLLLFVAVFWSFNRNDLFFRMGLIAFGSLSSPACVITLPLFWGRVIFNKASRKNEGLLALLATFLVAIQAWTMQNFKDPVASHLWHLKLRVIWETIIPKFLGAHGSFDNSMRLGLGYFTLIFMAVGIWKSKNRVVPLALLYLWAASILIGLSRVSKDIIEWAARYFFFPFILHSWVLLQIYFERSNRFLKVGSAILLGLSVIAVFPKLTRFHEKLFWKEHLLSCPHFENYKIPIHYMGSATESWIVKLPKEVCEEAVNRDPFFRILGTRKSYPFQLVHHSNEGPSAMDLSLGPKAANFYDAPKSTFRIPMKKGQQLWFNRNTMVKNPTLLIPGYEGVFFNVVPPEFGYWSLVEFSNSQLPDQFILELRGLGRDDIKP